MTNVPARQANNAFLEGSQEGRRGPPRMKFVKGKFFIGDDEVPLGRKYLAHMDGVVKAWVKFLDGERVDQKFGKVSDGFRWGERVDMGDNDKTLWERDADDKPKDPWSQQYWLPLEDEETGDLVLFVTSSYGGRDAVGELVEKYGRHPEKGRPIIELGASSYPNKKYRTRTEIPVFAIVDWDTPVRQPALADEAQRLVPTPEPPDRADMDADMDGRIPF